MKQLVNSKYVLVILTVLLFGLLLSQTVTYPQYNRVLDFKIREVKDGVLYGTSEFEMNNDNWFGYTGRDLTCKIYYKDVQIATGSNPAPFKLKRKSKSPLTLDVTFFMDSLRDELKTFLLKDSVELELKVHGKFSFLRIPMTKTMKTKISASGMANGIISALMKEGGLDLTKVKLKEFSPEFSVFNVGFKFKNKLPVELFLEKINFSIYAEKTERQRLAEWTFDIKEKMIRGQEKEISGDAKVDNLNSVLSGIVKVMNGDLKYYVSGNASIRIDDRLILVPIKQSFEVNPRTREIIIQGKNE